MQLEITFTPAISLGGGPGQMSEPVMISLPFVTSGIYSALFNFLSPYYPTSFRMSRHQIVVVVEVEDIDSFLTDINYYISEKEFTGLSLPPEDLLMLKLYLPAGSQVNFFPLYESYREITGEQFSDGTSV